MDHSEVYKQIIDRGSFENESYRLQYPFLAVEIENPLVDMVPSVPIGVAPPSTQDFIDEYYCNYILGGKGPEKNEEYCYSEDTEVLTDRGWLYFKDLIGDEKICSLNPITNVIEYQLPIENVQFRTTDPLYHIKSKHIDQLVSSGHSIYVSPENKINFNLIKIEDLSKYRYRIKKNGIWYGKKEEFFILPSVDCDNYRYKGYGVSRKIKMNTWLMFYGAWLADGSLRRYKDKNQYVVTITKQNKKERNIFLKVFSTIFDNVREYGKDILISDKQLYIYLEKFGKSKDKYIDRFFLELSKSHLKILFYWMYRCDGTKKSFSYSTMSKQLADDYQEICLKIGYSSSIVRRPDNGLYINYIYKNDIFNMPHFLTSKHIKRIQHSGSNIYCSRLPKYHILYIRRNGKVCWSGNTYAERIGEQLPTVMETLLKTPNTNQACMVIGRHEDVLISDPACFTGDSLLITDNGIKCIKDIEIGDSVLTHNNRFRKVTEVMSRRVCEKLYKIEGTNNITSNCTSEHPIFHLTPKKCDYNRICKETCNHNSKLIKNNDKELCRKSKGNKCLLHYKNYKPEWEEIKNIQKYPYTHSVTCEPEHIEETYNEIYYYLIGFYIGDGNLTHPKPSTNKGWGFTFNFNASDTKKSDNIKNIMFKLYGKDKYDERVVNNCRRLTYYSKELYEHFKNNFYNIPLNPNRGKGNGVYTCEYKTIPTTYIQLPKKHQEAFIKGMLDSDGYTRKNGYNEIYITSKDLRILIGVMINNVYGDSSSYVRKINKKNSFIGGREILSKKEGCVIVYKKGDIKKTHCIKSNSNVYRKRCNIEKSDIIYDGFVYNLEVEEDHSYIVDGYLPAHNCLREIDFKVIGDSLTLTTYWRSNDLWAGFPVNMGGMARLQEMVAEYIGKNVGKMYYYSSGSHVYEYQLDMIEAKIGKTNIKSYYYY